MLNAELFLYEIAVQGGAHNCLETCFSGRMFVRSEVHTLFLFHPLSTCRLPGIDVSSVAVSACCHTGFWLNIRMLFLSGTIMGIQLSRGLKDILYFWKWRFTGENAWFNDIDRVYCQKFVIGITGLYAVGVFADKHITMWLLGKQQHQRWTVANSRMP